MAEVTTLEHWKKFHNEIGTILGCEFREVNVTLAAAREVVSLVKKQKRQIERLLDLMAEGSPAFPKDCDKWRKEIAASEHLIGRG